MPAHQYPGGHRRVTAALHACVAVTWAILCAGCQKAQVLRPVRQGAHGGDAPAGALAAGRPGPWSGPPGPGPVRFRLPNGLRVVLQEDHAAHVVAVQAWVDGGATMHGG